MNFELHITCTKDIDKLSIDFSDGTSVIQSSKELSHEKTTLDDPLDLDTKFGELSSEVIQKPEIPDVNRPVKVAEELQNFSL